MVTFVLRSNGFDQHKLAATRLQHCWYPMHIAIEWYLAHVVMQLLYTTWSNDPQGSTDDDVADDDEWKGDNK
jgi:hypothetical protein